MNTLSLHKASKKFSNKVVLDAAKFTLSTGEILGVFGRNGSGKSTLLKCVFGALSADDFELTINNASVLQKDIIPKQLIAYLPQHNFFPKNITVRKLIPMYFKEGELQDQIFYAPNISKIATKKIGSLSLGELRYLSLLLVSFLDHPFLMLDEPFSMIDPLHKDLIKDFLIDLKKEKGILITDHYYKDVWAITDRNIAIHKGKTTCIDSLATLQAYGYLPQ